MTQHREIVELIQEIAREGRLARRAWPDELEFTPEDFGLLRAGDFLYWPDSVQTIDAATVRAELPTLATEVFELIDSTNTRLLADGAASSVADRLYLAEFQYGGRGRRGRSWMSPYGRNLSMSLGAATQRSLAELGGLSVVVGLALAGALEELGVQGLQLKWPNDVLVGDAKLCGILLELVQRGDGAEFVAGIGVNVTLTEQEVETIGQPVTDLRRCGVAESRTQLVIRLISKVSEYLLHFEREGFAPFVRAFNALHKFHGQTCSILQGETVVSGQVIGIGDSGELILLGDQGEQRFHGGEVSLRPLD